MRKIDILCLNRYTEMLAVLVNRLSERTGKIVSGCLEARPESLSFYFQEDPDVFVLDVLDDESLDEAEQFLVNSGDFNLLRNVPTIVMVGKGLDPQIVEPKIRKAGGGIRPYTFFVRGHGDIEILAQHVTMALPQPA